MVYCVVYRFDLECSWFIVLYIGSISLSFRQESLKDLAKPKLDSLNSWTVLPADILQQVKQIAPLMTTVGYKTDKTPMDYTKDLNPHLEETHL